MATPTELFGQLECLAIANGFDRLWDWLRKYEATLPENDELFHCDKCDGWLKTPEYNEQGKPVCCGQIMSQSPF